MSTIFSKIAKGEIHSYKIDENEDFFDFLDINPMAKGHTLVIPKKEVDYIFDLDDEVLAKLNIFAKKIAIAQKEALQCLRIGSMVIGLEVPHAHIHLIPINKESDMSLSNPRLKLSEEEFIEIANAIKAKL